MDDVASSDPMVSHLSMTPLAVCVSSTNTDSISALIISEYLLASDSAESPDATYRGAAGQHAVELPARLSSGPPPRRRGRRA